MISGVTYTGALAPNYSSGFVPSIKNILKVSYLFFSCIGSARGFSSNVMSTCASNKLFLSNGKSCCYLDYTDEYMSLDSCKELVRHARKTMKEQALDMHQAIKRGALFHAEEGYPLSDMDGKNVVGFGFDPKKSENCRKSYEYMQKTVLDTGNFFDQSEENILNEIKISHEKMTGHMPSDMTPGKLRKEAMLVTDPGVQKDYESYQREMRKKGGTRQEVTGLGGVLQKAQAGIELTKKELRTLKKLTPIMVSYTGIQAAMEGLVKELKIKMVDLREQGYPEKSVIQVAAWVHQELIRIHPFSDGNGRLARLWTNTVLELGGIPAVVFSNEATYISEGNEDLRSGNGGFARYLAGLIEANREVAGHTEL